MGENDVNIVDLEPLQTVTGALDDAFMLVRNAREMDKNRIYLLFSRETGIIWAGSSGPAPVDLGGDNEISPPEVEFLQNAATTGED